MISKDAYLGSFTIIQKCVNMTIIFFCMFYLIFSESEVAGMICLAISRFSFLQILKSA